jgi:hypothetical protein
MGLFDGLFGKKEKKTASPAVPLPPAKSTEMLDENIYWAIVNKSARSAKSQDGQERYLIKEIGKLTPTEMIGFRLRTDKLLYDTYNSQMWCAGYIMNGGCSDDMFEYFRTWVISRGKETYYMAKDNPDTLINEVIEGEEFYEFENFWYVALKAFKNNTGQDLYDFIDYEKFVTCEGKYPQFNFTWQEDDPESMRNICPMLYDKLWNG